MKFPPNGCSNSGKISLIALATLVLQAVLPTASAAGVDCLDTSEALAYWRPIRKAPASSSASADDLALELISCLGSPDPELRDQIGYELYVDWLRNDHLADATRIRLFDELSSRIQESTSDRALSRSFSALVLAELMRSDAKRTFLSADQRQRLLTDATEALQRETDYRGLIADIGWVHPIAHLGDLLWRFALHPQTTPAQGITLLRAVRSKVAPTQTTFAFNESDRLARVVSALIRRQLLEEQETAMWIESFAVPTTMEKWSDAFRSPQGMAELHNTKLFLRALSDQLAGDDVAAAIREPLEALIQGFTQLI